jgi:hypothetical protein
MSKVREFVKTHPKLSGALATAAVAGAAYYGVPPDITQAILAAVFGG